MIDLDRDLVLLFCVIVMILGSPILGLLGIYYILSKVELND